MVRKIEAHLPKFYEGTVDALQMLGSVEVGKLKCDDLVWGIYRCSVNLQPDCEAFWTGPDINHCAGYLIVSPRPLPNLPAWEISRGWVHKPARGLGIYPQLLACGADTLKHPLVSDSEGMTQAAYDSWMRATRIRTTMFDGFESVHSEIAAVPVQERFVEGALGAKWRLVAWPAVGWDGFISDALSPQP